jgi:hypothetical protein
VPKDVEKKINFRGVPAILVVKMDMMKKQLEDVKFDKLIEESKFLPDNVRDNFKDFTQQMLKVVRILGARTLRPSQYFCHKTNINKYSYIFHMTG